MKIVPLIVLMILAIVLSGCATSPKENIHNFPLPAVKLLGSNGTRKNSEKIGIALAGGGTKAAAYSMGVLTAVAKNDEELARIDAISSVSGGSYASLFLYS
ncbi:MAG: patatin-like phospholipase family protein [Methylococcales bacterium]|jgi:uncharacterized lipoprotein YmbA|nr:patatin-like phospholipase family protein [Methylococcales bacterium]